MSDVETDERKLLDAAFERIVLELGMKSTVEATKYGRNTGAEQSKPPPGTEKPEFGHYELERLIRRYERAISNIGRRKVVDEANTELKTWRRQAKPASDGITFEQVVIEDGLGHTPEMVGERYGLSPHHVRRIRKRHGRQMNDGLPLDQTKKPTIVPEERRAEITRMRGQGMSKRQIAMVLRCSEATVRKDIRDGA